ncbi:MAG: biotin--[acetyl-CoA-carboxylase] ligase [Terracidiphilus sp.]|jgi:BirA family biotin operon repressor/biotin-[acetyl-CoA-carboxylase] ligase
MFDLPALEAALAGTIYAGKLHFSPVTQSTNTDALDAARAGAPHGSVFFADEQLAGRGRGDHAWHSAAGQGLYVSILLRPTFPAARLTLLPLAAGLAARHATHETAGLNVDLRWPNDLLIGSRKVGGILVEGKTASSNVAHAVVGIGINVHQRTFPGNLDTPPTSLEIETSSPVSRQTLFVELLNSLDGETLSLHDPDAVSATLRHVQQASTWIAGRRVHVHGPQACTGVTEGLDENGFLLVRTATGLVTVQTGGLRTAEDEPKQQ